MYDPVHLAFNPFYKGTAHSLQGSVYFVTRGKNNAGAILPKANPIGSIWSFDKDETLG